MSLSGRRPIFTTSLRQLDARGGLPVDAGQRRVRVGVPQPRTAATRASGARRRRLLAASRRPLRARTGAPGRPRGLPKWITHGPVDVRAGRSARSPRRCRSCCPCPRAPRSRRTRRAPRGPRRPAGRSTGMSALWSRPIRYSVPALEPVRVAHRADQQRRCATRTMRHLNPHCRIPLPIERQAPGSLHTHLVKSLGLGGVIRNLVNYNYMWSVSTYTSTSVDLYIRRQPPARRGTYHELRTNPADATPIDGLDGPGRRCSRQRRRRRR